MLTVGSKIPLTGQDAQSGTIYALVPYGIDTYYYYIDMLGDDGLILATSTAIPIGSGCLLSIFPFLGLFR